MRDMRPLEALVGATFGGLLLLVLGLGVLGLWAEYTGTWRSLFVFEQTVRTAAPAVTAAAAGTILVGGIVVVRAG